MGTSVISDINICMIYTYNIPIVTVYMPQIHIHTHNLRFILN